MNSLNHYNLLHNFVPLPQAMNIPDAKAAVDKELDKFEKFPSSMTTNSSHGQFLKHECVSVVLGRQK